MTGEVLVHVAHLLACSVLAQYAILLAVLVFFFPSFLTISKLVLLTLVLEFEASTLFLGSLFAINNILTSVEDHLLGTISVHIVVRVLWIFNETRLDATLVLLRFSYFSK